MKNTLVVALEERSYPIHIGVGLMGLAELILPHIKQKKVVVVTNTTVAPLYLEVLRSTLKIRQKRKPTARCKPRWPNKTSDSPGKRWLNCVSTGKPNRPA